ncbi:MAG TPA: TonB-dependent receptor [Arenimonas sp.]|nr:TonB-dependent receptor [Arenimonas sp.]
MNVLPRTPVSPLRRSPLLVAIALALAAPLASAQDAPPADESTEEAAADDTAVLDAIIVTGTRRTDRTVAESLSPIDVLDATEVQRQGSTEINQALARLIPSYNFPRASITDGTDHVRPAQLRGLAPDQTLVLVNGKRRHRSAVLNLNGSVGRGSSPVDLNAIPANAIARIEVLRDGAAAQYGSDAIAGVINIVLKGAGAEGSLDARYGEHKEGDGELVDLGAFTSVGDERLFVALSAEYRDRGATNRAGLDPRQQYPLVGGQPDPREATFDRLNHRFGDADVQDRLFFFNAGGQLGGAELYAFGNLSLRDGEAGGFYRRALDARNILAIYPDGYLPLIVSESADKSFNAGVRGESAGGWRWDASLGWGRNEFDYNVANSLNVDLGPTSPTEFFAGRLEAGQVVANLDLSKDFDWGLAYPVTFSTGIEAKEETYAITAGEPASYFGSGSQVFPGFRPANALDVSRDSWAVYGEVEADLTDNFSASAAVRYEDYSDFGDATSGKLSGRYVFNDVVSLRGTVSTGFRAPTLAQQYYSTTATVFVAGVPFDIRTFPVNDPVAVALGAEPLKAEESTSLSLGLGLQFTPDWNVTLDAYQIDIDDRIILSEELRGPAVRAFLAANGFPQTDGGRYFTNAIDTRTRGIDLVSSHRWDLGGGELNLTVGANYNDTDITRIAPNPEVLDEVALGLTRIGRAEIGRVTVGSPKDKLVVGLDYDREAWSFRVGATAYGEYTTYNTNPALDQTFGREVVLDAAVSYRFDRGLTATVGADNLTDAYPDEVIAPNAFNGIFPYAVGNTPFGFNGAFYYARLNWVF